MPKAKKLKRNRKGARPRRSSEAAVEPASSRADVLLHPVRLRIVQCLAAAKEATAADLANALEDVAPASLYRHLKKLEDAELVLVVSERRVRGAMERTFALPPGQGNLTQDDIDQATAEDHGRWFLTFALGLHAKLSRYLAGYEAREESADFARDGVGYHTMPLWLSDDEFQAFTNELNAAVLKVVANRPEPGRRLRNFSTVVLPEVDVPTAADEATD